MVAHRVRDELVLVHLETNRIFELTTTAGRVWDLLETMVDPDAIQEILQREYEVAADRLTLELDRTLALLAENRLVEVVPIDAAPTEVGR